MRPGKVEEAGLSNVVSLLHVSFQKETYDREAHVRGKNVEWLMRAK